MAKTAKTARDLFITSLRDIYDAEKELIRALPKMAAAAENPALREAFDNHRTETEAQVERLNAVFRELGEPARPKRCEAIRSLISEGERHIREFGDTSAGDAALAAAGRSVEHYEITKYTSLKRLAEELGMTESAKKLDATLKEEMAASTLLDELGQTGARGTSQGAAEAAQSNQMSRGLRAGDIQHRTMNMARDSNYRERDDEGRFMSADDRGSSRGRSRYEDDDDRRGFSRSRSRYDDDDDRRMSPSRSRDDDEGRGRGGWFGDSEGHSEASRRGFEGRDDDRRSMMRGRSRYDEDEGRGRGRGGWFGDSEGHSEASRRGWESRDDDRRSMMRGRGGDDDYRSSRSRFRDDDDDRRGRRTGGWFGDSEGHSEAAHKGWDRGREPGGWFGDSEGHSEASRRAWERGRESGGWFGDPEGHSEASRRGWESRDDERRSSRRYYRD